MPTTFQTRLKERQQETFFSASRGYSEPVTVAGTSTRAIVIRRGTMPAFAERSEQSTESGEAILNKAEVTLTRLRPNDFGTLVAEDGTSWTISGIVRESPGVYHVQLTRLVYTQHGRTTLQGGR